MTRVDPPEKAKCAGLSVHGCPLKADAAHSFVQVTDFGVTIEDLCSECYECLHT